MQDTDSSIPSIFSIIENNFPPGTELVGFCTPEGVSYSEQQLKAIEWQEKKMRNGELNPTLDQKISGILESLSVKADKPVRTLKSLFKFRHGKIMICNDDTVWFLSPEVGAEFEPCAVDILPRIPQEA